MIQDLHLANKHRAAFYNLVYIYDHRDILGSVALAMADPAAGQGPNRPKARQSIAHMPSSRTAALKDNVTTDIAALQAQSSASQAAKKKSRGKSLGPGGLEALTETTGNMLKVCLFLLFPLR